MSKITLNTEKIDWTELTTFSQWWNMNKVKYEGIVTKDVAKEIWGASNDAVMCLIEQLNDVN